MSGSNWSEEDGQMCKMVGKKREQGRPWIGGANEEL